LYVDFTELHQFAENSSRQKEVEQCVMM